MSTNQPNFLIPLVFFFFFFFYLCSLCEADIGTAAAYNPPYSPTECFRTDPRQFPSNNLFAAAGDEIWDNGESCGREYSVRCVSAATPNTTCRLDQTIQVRIVDYAPDSNSRPSVSGTTMVLSVEAFHIIAGSSPTTSINIEFQRM